MPVNIYRIVSGDRSNEKIAWLCDDEWLLWVQVETLSKWLQGPGSVLQPDEYVADIGFCWRRNASAGGPVLEPATMKRMSDLGMSLFLSEYSGFANEAEPEKAEPDETAAQNHQS